MSGREARTALPFHGMYVAVTYNNIDNSDNMKKLRRLTTM